MSVEDGAGIVKVKVTLRLTIGQSVSKSWCRAPFRAHDQIFITVWQLRSCFCGAPSVTRGRVCFLYMLLALASAAFLVSESLSTRDHILLSQSWDFRFRRLLRLAGLRWRYSTPWDSGIAQSVPFYNCHAARIEQLKSSCVILCFVCCVNLCATLWFVQAYSLLRNISCLATCYLATTRSLLFVVAGTWLPSRCSAMDVRSGFQPSYHNILEINLLGYRTTTEQT
jgi:hypothetical protein